MVNSVSGELAVFFFSFEQLTCTLKLEVADFYRINLLTPNVNYSGRTAPLTSEVAFYIFIQQI